MKHKIFILLVLIQVTQAVAQKAIPTIIASIDKASTRVGDNNPKNVWTITPSVKPDVLEVVVPKGKKIKCTFYTDVDSISFNVEQGKKYDFVIILNKKDSAYTRISGISEPVYFSNDYQKNYYNKTVTEIPEVYELTNIIIALTSKGLNDSDIVEHNTKYYKDVMAWFGKYKTDRVVLSIDSLMRKEWWKFFYLKMDSYAYNFKDTKIVKSSVYDRLNFDAISNTIEPFKQQIQQFANKSDFRTFYNNHKTFYQNQISYYKDSLNVLQMQRWLNKNFPKTKYNCYKIVFSPLTGGSQSANFFTNNNFSEAHVYINFPYFGSSDKNVSKSTNYLSKGNVLFTELNHAYINPEAKNYLETNDFKIAFGNLKLWEADSSAAAMGYPNAYACFNEYMNWALVSLYYIDFMSSKDQPFLISRLEKNMQAGSGFIKFPEFNRMIMELYRNKKTNESIADLYPKIIGWCRDQTK